MWLDPGAIPCAGLLPWIDAVSGTLPRRHIGNLETRHARVRRLATWSQR